MPGEETSSTVVVDVDGTPLPEAVAARLISAVVDDSRSVPALFILTFLDTGAAALKDGGFSIGAAVRISVQRSGPGGPAPLLSGEVTGIEVESGPSGARTTVRGYDHSHRLHRGRRVEAYLDVTADDIARRVASRAGLRTGKIDSFGPVMKHVGQGGVSDWAFLRDLAAGVGAEVVVVDGALCFRKPEKAAAASGGADARQDPLVLESGVNLISLRAGVTASDQVPEVEVRGWDVLAKKAVVAQAPAKTVSAAPTGIDPAKLARTFKAPVWVETRSRQSVQAACQSTAVAIADRIAGSCAEIDGVARGNPKLRAGTAITLTNVGTPFDGNYVLSSTRHEFTGDRGYVTKFTVSNASERSVYGLATGAAGPGSRSARMGVNGVLTAVVTDVKDPDGQGRVRVTFPVMSDQYVSGWARTVQLGAGAQRGSLVLPEVGDEVLVSFGMGDFDEPYILGGLYNGKDKPKVGWREHVDGTTGAIKRRAFVSRTGMVIEFIESTSEEKLTLSTTDGKQRITLVQKAAAAIEIISEGPVKVTAKQDVNVQSSGGNVTVASTSGNVTVESASGNLTLKGLKIAIEAQTELNLKGVNVKIAGQAMAELSASGITTVKGSLVKIN